MGEVVLSTITIVFDVATRDNQRAEDIREYVTSEVHGALSRQYGIVYWLPKSTLERKV